MINSFSGQRYYPPAAEQTGEQQVSQLPARPTIVSAPAVIVNGKLRSTFGPPAAGRAWLVRRITVQGTVKRQAFMYVGDELPENLVAGTRSGTFDENDPRQPYFVPESTPLLIVWQTDSSGSALARIEYVEV